MNESIEQYQSLVDKAIDLAYVLSQGRPENIVTLMSEIEIIQEQAAATDIELIQMISTQQDTIIDELFNKRFELMKQLARLNQLLVSSLEGRMSLMTNEIGYNRKAQTAMNGYRTSSPASKGYVHYCAS